MSIRIPSVLKRFNAARLSLAVAALSLAAATLLETGSVGAVTTPTPIAISNIPLTVAMPAHPQVLIAIGNSESMDGDLSGAIMTGSGALTVTGHGYLEANNISPINYAIPSGFTPPVNPGALGYAPYTVTSSGVQYDNSSSRLNVAKAGITAILTDFMQYADFALEDYSTTYNNCCGTNPYTTWVYYMSNTGGFTFQNTVPGSGEYVTNPCYNVPLDFATTVDSDCKSMDAHYGGIGINTFQYMPIGSSSDDPAINDALYATGWTAAWINFDGPSHPDPYTFFGLAQYNTGGVNEGYGAATAGGIAPLDETPTNAGYVPYSTEVMQVERGFGFIGSQSATSGTTLVSMQSSGAAPTTASVAAAIAPFTPYLAAETNSVATTEIKAMAIQSPIAGLLTQALTYMNGVTTSSNGCPAQKYVVLVTDGLPTEDKEGRAWPPLGSVSGVGYGLTVTFNGDGSLGSTNDVALQEAITELADLKTAGIETYVIGLGAGVETAANPQAAATLTAMAIAGGTGTYFPATTPSDLTYDMQVILADILSATQSTASATVNTTGLDTTSVAYQPSFTTRDTDQDWTGNLTAYPINPTTGAVETGTPLWTAQALLDTQDASFGWSADRIIATWDPVAGAGIPFRWTNGTPSTGIGATTMLGEELQSNPLDTNGRHALEYLRGDRAREVANGGPYRSRTHILGDIVDSAPLYIGVATAPYQSTTYYTFENSVASREPVLYTGANDGMLHAFSAATGRELFAYIPNGVFSNLINLTSQFYNTEHRFYVDGSPQAADVQFTDGTWHTELVGGENAGGNTVYALDVTNPAGITNEASLAADVLWEFSDVDMGLSYSAPAIAQTAVGASGSNLGFTVFFGNGYNSPSEDPILYAVDPQTGALRIKINLCTQVPTACDTTKPNGLSTPVVINDIGGLGAPATTLYAGDLEGNLWRVSVSDPDPANWTVTVLYQATDPSGVRQPITTEPVVSLNPDFPRMPGVMVYFGTGQMLSIADLASTQVQTMYGVYDTGSNPSMLTRLSASMQQQTLSGVSGYSNLRQVNGGPITLPADSGWYVDMTLLSGERFVTDPRIDAGAVIATTVQPSPNTCTAGDNSWLMEFNFAGGTFITPQFDTNGDGSVNSMDQIANGMQLGSGGSGVYGTAIQVLTTPCTTNCTRIKLVTETGTSGTSIQNITERGSQAQRTSWREIR